MTTFHAALPEASALAADALPDAALPDAAALEEPPDEQPTRASAATTIAMAARTINFLAFMLFLPYSF